jgi:hypothetical protein
MHLLESAAIAAVLLARWALDRHLFEARVLDQPVTVALLAYVLVRVLLDGVYLVPCAAYLVASLLRPLEAPELTWLAALQCPFVHRTLPRVILTAAPLALALASTLWSHF